MKTGIIACSIIAIAWVALAVIQIWFAPFGAGVFMKISITAGLLFAVILVISLVVREYFSEKKMKDDGYIDG